MRGEVPSFPKQAWEKAAEDYYRVERIIAFLESHPTLQPSLEELAETVGLSVFQFQRLFSRWVGISPKRFCQYLTREYARKLLLKSTDVLSATYQSGLSSPSRLHDLFLTTEAVRPGDIRTRGKGLEIRYGFYPSPFGKCLMGVTEKGICTLRFVQQGMDEQDLVTDLEKKWPEAHILYDPDPGKQVLDRVFPYPLQEWADSNGSLAKAFSHEYLDEGSVASSREKASTRGNGSTPRKGQEVKLQPPGPLHLYVQGTNFQIKVWEALIQIPLGEAVSYERIARKVGDPKASRAVGGAVGENLIPFLIPCHRVLRKNGEFGNYGEGPLRKKAILAWEAALKERILLTMDKK